MKKAIIILASTGFQGHGDFFFALKLAEQIKNQYQGEAPPIYVVSQEEGKGAIVRLQGHAEFNVQVISSTRLKQRIAEKAIDVGQIIEGPVFNDEWLTEINEMLPKSETGIPLLMLPEYGFNSDQDRTSLARHADFRKELSNIRYTRTLYSGFNTAKNEKGIILSAPPPADQLLNQIDGKVRAQIYGANSLANYQASTELSMQYSHDTYVGNAAEHYLRVHREFIKGNSKNQDVLLVGGNQEKKMEALAAIKDKLIADGFTHISFFNTATQKEVVLYHSDSPGKTYRAIYAPKMTHESMIACTALSGPLMGSTGDQSLGEATSANKIMVYETLAHKKVLINDYDKAIKEASQQNAAISETLTLLRNARSDPEYARLGQLLRTPELQANFVNASQNVIRNSNFTSAVVREGLLWNPEEAVRLLQQNKPHDAIRLMRQGNINIFTTVNNQCIIDYAPGKESFGPFAPFYRVTEQLGFEIVTTNNRVGAFRFMERAQISPFIPRPADGKSILAVALDARDYGLVDALLQRAQTHQDKQAIGTLLHSKNPEGKTYLAQLQQEHPEKQYSMTKKATYFSALTHINNATVENAPQRVMMHHSFQDLMRSFDTFNADYEDKAFIGLLLLNKKSIEAEYKYVAPDNPMFGSNLYIAGETALKNLGINAKALSPEQEKEYFSALQKAIDARPEYLANQFLLSTFNKYSGLPPLDKKPQMSTLDWRDVLTNKKPPPPNTIIMKTADGAYVIASGAHNAGNFGAIHTAQHYKLDKQGYITITPPSIAKKLPNAQSKELDKEFRMFQTAHPEDQLLRENIGQHSYLVMPRRQGEQLDRYLEKNPVINNHERLVMAEQFLMDLNSVHKKGINHNDLKPQNIIYDPLHHKMQIIDFGCAETVKTKMKYTDIESSVFAFEMPPEYLKGADAHPSMDVFAATPIVAEILGVNKRALIRARMNEAFKSIDDPKLQKDIAAEFEKAANLGDVFFTPAIQAHKKNPNLEKFITTYVNTPYNFSPYKEQLGKELIDMLNSMQSLDPKDRPSIDVCLKNLHKMTTPAPMSAAGNPAVSAQFKQPLYDIKADRPPPPHQSFAYYGHSKTAHIDGHSKSGGATAAAGTSPPIKEPTNPKTNAPPSDGAAVADHVSTTLFKAQLANMKTEKPTPPSENPNPLSPGNTSASR
ncbi:protein kinase domain-containing protein [Legionella sp. WA2022007384]